MKYGYPKLGDINKFLRQIAGDEIFFQFLEKDIPDMNDYDKKRLQKKMIRLENEESKDFSDYRFEDNEILLLTRKFFSSLEDEYCFPSEISFLVFQFLDNILLEYKKEKGCNVPDYPIRNCALLSLNQTINLIMIPEFLQNHSQNEFQEKLKSIVNMNLSYKELFEQAISNSRFNSTHDYLFNLSLTDSDDSNHFSSFQDNYDKAVKENKNPGWERFNIMISYFSKELQEKFIFHYVTNAIKTAFIDIFELTQKDFDKFREDLISLSTCQNFQETTQNIINYYAPLFIRSGQTIYQFYQDTFINNLYKTTGVIKFYESLEALEAAVPNSSKFFIPWFKGYICEVQNFHDEAVSWFDKAFENYNLAGDFLHKFLEMAFSLENHSSNWRNVRQSINTENNVTTPLSPDAKKYWSLGYSIGLFNKKADEVYMESYHPAENYWKFFPPKAFLNQEQAESIMQNEMNAENGIHLTQKKFNQDTDNKIYNFFCSLKTSTQKNTRISRYKPEGEKYFENRNQKRLYSPLALCIQKGERDIRLWELAITWLKDEKNPVDVDLLCFNGSTALHEALTQYKNIRRRKPDSEEEKLLRNLVLLLADKATYLGATTFQKQIHTLQEAIHCFDEEVIIKIADKISPSDFQSYLISADEVSPLYYLLLCRQILLNGVDSFLNKRKLFPNNMLWKNLAVEGFTEKEKCESLNKVEGNQFYEIFTKEMLIFESGIKFKDTQLEVFNHVADYFISRTENQDSFIKMPPDSNQGCTTLYFAAEIDDVFICKKLLEAGANYKLKLGIAHNPISDGSEIYFPNTFIYRLITFDSWKTLKVFLGEYPDLATNVMHKDESNITPLVYFITKFLNLHPVQRYPLLQDFMEIIALFKKCGSDLDESTELGCARFWIEKNK